MNNRHAGYRAIYPSVDPEDRFLALEEAHMLLLSRNVDLDDLLIILSKSADGCIDFCFGDITIQFVRGFGVWSERKDVIQMTVEVQKGDFGDVVGYEYTLDELRKSYKPRLVKFGTRS